MKPYITAINAYILGGHYMSVTTIKTINWLFIAIQFHFPEIKMKDNKDNLKFNNKSQLLIIHNALEKPSYSHLEGGV